MPTPSLLIVPARFKTGTLYSQIPVPVAPSTSSVGDFTVTRALNTATRVGPDGLIASVASGIPRLDYYTSGGVTGCPALLVEPSAQNLALQSEAFNVSGTWTNLIAGTGVNPVVTTNAVVSPDGTQNAETVAFNRGAGNALIDQSTLQQFITILTSGSYIFSVYAKASTSGDVGKQVFLRLGSAGILSAITLTANWNRYTKAETSVASGSQSIQIGNRGTITADNTVSVDLWGAQLETGSVATSYIPTTTGSVTRNADVITVSGAVSGSIGQTEGTIYAEVDVTNRLNGTAALTLAKDANVSGRVILYTNTNNRWRANYTDASGTIVDTSAANDTQVLGVNKLAFAYGAGGDATVHCNGSLIITLSGTSTFVQELRAIFLGSSNGGALFFNNRIRAAALYTTRLTNAELALITQP